MTHILDLNRLWGDLRSKVHGAVLGTQDLRRISVILVAKGRYDFLRSLSHVVYQPFLHEVIIVDMGLTSVLREALESFIKEHPQCHIISGREEAGLAEAYNLGAHFALSHHLVFMTEKVLLPKNALARLFAFTKQKSSPYVVGLTVQSRRAWEEKKESWIGRLTGFCVQQPLKESAFSSTTRVRHEVLFMPSRTLGMLKGIDSDYYGDTAAWDFCLRVHYHGGEVYQANRIKMMLQEPVLPTSWRDNWIKEWKQYLSWRYFYQKYARKQTNLLKRLSTELFFFFAFLHAGLFH